MSLYRGFSINNENKSTKVLRNNKFKLLIYLFFNVIISDLWSFFFFFLASVLAIITSNINYNFYRNVKDNFETVENSNEGVISELEQLNKEGEFNLETVKNKIKKEKNNDPIDDKKMKFSWDFIFFKINKQMKWRKFISVFILFLIFVKGLTSFAHWYLNSYCFDKVEKDLKVELFKLLTNSKYEKSFNVFSKMLTQFSSDLDNVARGIWSIPNRLIYVVFSIFFNFSGKSRSEEGMNIEFILIIISLFSMLIIISYSLLQKSFKIGNISKERYEEDNRYIFERVNNLEYIKVNSSENFEQSKLLERLNVTFKKNKEFLFWNSMFKSIPNYFIIPNIPFVFMFIATFMNFNSGKNVCHKILSFINIVDWFYIVRRINVEVGKIIEAIGSIDEISTDASKINENISKLEEERNGNEKFSKGNIIFKNVSFSYLSRPTIKVIDNFSFIFENGKIYGIAGKNGMGKSTITKLLLKLYTINEGNISIGSTNIYNLKKGEISKNICYLTNKPFFFNYTIAENVFYPFYDEAKSTMSDLEILKSLEDAAEKAGILEFINSLPERFNTIIDSGGSNLSEGQKQQIEAIKFFLKFRNYKFFIFDEVLSNVHPEIRSYILNNFFTEARAKGISGLVIDHHYYIFRHMDYVYNFRRDGLTKINDIEKDLEDS